MRKKLLDITRQDVEGLAPMSEGLVMAFARKAQDQFDATWAIAELGIAGPTGVALRRSRFQCDWYCWTEPDIGTARDRSDDREHNMWRFTEHAFALLCRAFASAG